MDFDAACEIVRAHMVANFTGVPLQWENETPPSAPWPPTDGSGNPLPWGEGSFRHVRDEQRSIGAPGDQDWEEGGALVVWLFVPRMGGQRRGRQLRELLAAAFRGRDLPGVGGSVEITGLLPDDSDDAEPGDTESGKAGPWWRRGLRIEFEWQTTA